MLFYASRIINYHSVILKALDDNQTVICDRFHYSTLVYQGLINSDQDVINLHKNLDHYFSEKISLIFYLDADIDTCLARLNRRETSDKFESKGRKFLEKIQEGYEDIFKENKKAIKIETTQDKSTVNKIIAKHIDGLFND